MADRTGQQLGNYRILSSVGRGGFAEVYLGEHIYLKTQVAIKILQSKVANDEDLEGFLKEARTIAHLVHPNIVRVMDFGVDSETPFLVMDYASNGTLRRRHPKGSTLPLNIITPYIKQVAAALQYAHDEKLIHRDVKPENMLLGRKNEVLLGDFGIALIAQSSRYQSTQDVVGTVAYMSPEQIQGKPRPASDQYSLAIVVYEWLTGDRPFHGSFTELCTQHMFASPPLLRERVPTISPDVEHVVTTALAKDPRQRFGSVQAFANALEQASQSGSLSRPKAQPTPILVPPLESTVPPTIEVKSAPLPITSPYTTPPDIAPPPPPNTMPPYNYSPQSYQSRARTQIPSAKKPWWSIGRSQLIAMLISTVLFGICFYEVENAAYNFNSSLFQPIIPAIRSGNFSFYFTYLGLLLGLAIAIPLFFAVEFGLWAGLVSIVAGSMIGDAFAFHQLSPTWYYYLSYAVFIFIPGFALALARSRSTDIVRLPRIIIWSAIGLVAACLIQIIGDRSYFLFLANDWVGAFFGDTLSSGVCLILLLILLIVYRAISKRRRPA